jgi:predicted RNase H-like nuclease (RuvC/YqgF family)
MSIQKICASCLCAFDVDEKYSYIKLCKTCYAVNKQNELPPPPKTKPEIVLCQHCGKTFERLATEKHKTLCKTCFIEDKKHETERLKTENEQLKQRIKELEDELACRNDKFSLAKFELQNLKIIALEHEIQQLTGSKKPLPTDQSDKGNTP